MDHRESAKVAEALAAGYSLAQIFPCRAVPCACKNGEMTADCHMGKPENWKSLEEMP
jgi:hypothetical protein